MPVVPISVNRSSIIKLITSTAPDWHAAFECTDAGDRVAHGTVADPCKIGWRQGSFVAGICLIFMTTPVLGQLVAHGNGCIKNPSDFVIRWGRCRAIIGIR